MTPSIVADTRRDKAFDTHWQKPDRHYVVRPSYEEVDSRLHDLISWANIARESLQLAVDLETRGNFIACIGIAWTKKLAMCIPILTTQKGKKDGYWTLDEEFEILLKLRQLLTHPKVRVVGQNFGFDVQYIVCLLYTSPSPRDRTRSRMPSSA